MKFDSEFVGKLLKEKLGTGECAGKGYVLDNYPKSYQDCLNVFAKAHKKRIKIKKIKCKKMNILKQLNMK